MYMQGPSVPPYCSSTQPTTAAPRSPITRHTLAALPGSKEFQGNMIIGSVYHEGLAGQPGPGAPNHDALNEWIFGGTALGEAFLQIADHLTEADDGMARLVRGLLIPEGHYRGGRAFPETPEFGAADDREEQE